jgi:hypothetical protein
LHVLHCASLVRYSVVVSPRTASAKSSVSVASTSAPRCGPAGAEAPPPRPTAVEHLAEQVAETVGADVEVVATGPAARAAGTEASHGAEATDLVVLLALGVVAEHVVGGADLLEPLLGGGVTGVVSGWLSRASLRYALVISLASRGGLTPRTL